MQTTDEFGPLRTDEPKWFGCGRRRSIGHPEDRTAHDGVGYRRLMPAPHVTKLKVRFNELDPYGHVNHAQYISYFEHGRTEALEAVGLGLHEMSHKGVQVVVMDLQARYKAAAVGGDVLTIETSIVELRRASTMWGQRILRTDASGQEQEVATLTIRGGITDNTGRPMRPPPWLFDAMGPLLADEPAT